MGEKILGGHDHFLREGSSYAENEYNLFHRKLDAKNFYIKQFFQKKQKKTVFSEETVENSSGGAFDHFLGKGGF